MTTPETTDPEVLKAAREAVARLGENGAMSQVIAEIKWFDRRGGLGLDTHDALEKWAGILKVVVEHLLRESREGTAAINEYRRSGSGVVKALEWKDLRGHSFPNMWCATSPCGVYDIEERSASDSPAYVALGPHYAFIADKDSLEEAKAAAQTDFERRIRSALAEPAATIATSCELVTADVSEKLRVWIWEQIEKHGENLAAVQPTFDLILNKIDEFRDGIAEPAAGEDAADIAAAKKALAECLQSGGKPMTDLAAELGIDIHTDRAALIERQTRKIYLASRYSRFPEMQKVRADLEAAGYVVTSRWINGGHELTKEGSTEAHEAERVRYAQEDFADLLAADCVISFTEIPRETKTRGGRHVEHGMALALGKRVVVIGYRENVFHCLPQCEFFSAWPDALAALSPSNGGK